MGSPWFTNPGEVGDVEIEKDQNQWVITDKDIGKTNCIFREKPGLEESVNTAVLTVRAETFRQGLDENPNFLTVTTLDSKDASSSDIRTTSDGSEVTHSQSVPQDRDPRNDTTANDTTDTDIGDPTDTTGSSQMSPSSTSNETWELAEFSGSGEYVNVEAKIDSISFVKKDEPGIPDIKGELRDDSILQAVTFVIAEGVSHPHMERGKRYRFESVKDHYYKGDAEIQVVIGQYTDFVELG